MKQNEAGIGAWRPDDVIDPAIQARIGQRLRVMYDAVAAQPTPDRLLRLIDELDGGDPGRDT